MTPQRAAIYKRISRDRTGAGLGVGTQGIDCRRLAEERGYTVVVEYDDNDLSAYSGKARPGYLALLEDIRGGRVDVVVAWHTDRLHRSPVELEDYIAACDLHGVPTITVTAGPIDLASPSGRLVARQLGAVARYEVEHQIERQKRAKLRSAEAGIWKGGRRPFGFEPDGVTVRADEAAEVLAATEALIAGASLISVLRDWNGRGVLTTTGGAWSGTADIRRALVRPRNAGLMQHRGEVVGEAQWKAIVPRETWEALVRLMGDPTRSTQQGQGVRRWMGSGVYLCGLCEAPATRRMIVSSFKRGGYPVYSCREFKHVARRVSTLDRYISDLVIERLGREDALDLLNPPNGVDLTALAAELTALRSRLTEQVTLHSEGLIDGQQLAEGTRHIRQQMAAAEAEMASASRGSALAGLAGAEDVRASWEGLDVSRQSAVIRDLMEVVVMPAPRGRPRGWTPGSDYFDIESIAVTWRD